MPALALRQAVLGGVAVDKFWCIGKSTQGDASSAKIGK